MSRTTFLNVDDSKAGMEDLDKEKINKLIQEASKSRRVNIGFFNRFYLYS
jgi:ABC-type branched-subunit amino acid transport system ATPase component